MENVAVFLEKEAEVIRYFAGICVGDYGWKNRISIKRTLRSYNLLYKSAGNGYYKLILK